MTINGLNPVVSLHQGEFWKDLLMRLTKVRVQCHQNISQQQLFFSEFPHRMITLKTNYFAQLVILPESA